MGVHRRPAHPSVQESAQVFDDLKKDQRPLGQIGFDEKTVLRFAAVGDANRAAAGDHRRVLERSEEHTSELQSQSNLVCRLLLEKKKKKRYSKCNTTLHRQIDTVV